MVQTLVLARTEVGRLAIAVWDPMQRVIAEMGIGKKLCGRIFGKWDCFCSFLIGIVGVLGLKGIVLRVSKGISIG